MDQPIPEPADNPLVADRITPAQITIIYVVFGLALLVLFDVVLPLFVAASDLLALIQGVKAGIEVLLTGGLIYVLVGRMERQLETSERRFRNLLRNAPVPINIFDSDGKTVWGNDAVLDLLDLEDRDSLTGRSIFEFIHEDDHGIAEGEATEVIERGEVVGPTPMRLQSDGGETLDVQVKTLGLTHQGELVGVAVVNDVTELRRTERELRRERDFIEHALDALRDVFYVLTADGDLERWNSRLNEVTGLDDAALAGMDAADFVPDADEPAVASAIETALETGTSFVETDFLTADGGTQRYEWKSAFLKSDDGAGRLVGVGRDVTERIRLERELRENEKRYRTLVEMSPNPVLVHADADIVYANDALADLIGADESADLLGEFIGSFLDPDEPDLARDTAQRTQRGEHSPTRAVRTVRTRTGRERIVETTSRPISYEGAPAVLTVLNDVTRRKRHAEQLKTLHDRTREMTRAEDPDAIGTIAAEAAGELLVVEDAGFFRFDDEALLATDDGTGATENGANVTQTGDETSRRGGIDSGPVWDAFVAAEPVAIEGPIPDLDGEYGYVIPVGNHGVLAVAHAADEPVEGSDRELAGLIARNAAAALDRAERERRLREHDRQLREQNESLAQLDRLNAIIRQINQSLIRSASPAEIGERVCSHFAETDQYAFAWMAERGGDKGSPTPIQWAGVDAEYVDGLGSDASAEPLRVLVAAAFEERRLQVARGVLEDSDWAAARNDALTHDFRAVAAIPVVSREQVTRVLVVHASHADLFDDRERAVLAELGETVGYALANVERSNAIRSDDRTEVQLSIPDERLFTNRFAAVLGADVEFVGSVAGDGTGIQAFLRIDGADGEAVEDGLGDLESVRAVRVLSVEDDAGLYQVTISTPALLRVLGTYDARLRSLATTGDGSTLTAVLDDGTGVRTLVEAVQADYPDAELLARREEPDPVDTRETFRDELLAELTEKQRESLRTAFFGGFYEWPRETTSEALASSRGVAASTFQYHLRAAERKLVGSVLA